VECECDACGKSPLVVTEVLTELPLILTVQFKHCGRGQSYRPRRFDFATIAVDDRKYRLCAFTEYEGSSPEGGKFGCVFLSWSGTWNTMRRGTIESIPLAPLNDFRPQLLFFTADEPNDVPETASLVRIQTEADSDEESESRVTQAQANDSFVQAVAERLRRAQREDAPDVVVPKTVQSSGWSSPGGTNASALRRVRCSPDRQGNGDFTK
jgi:hypothetical protein